MPTTPSRPPEWLTRWVKGDLSLQERPLASLVLTSGQIAACDPLVFLASARPLDKKLKPGKYKVVLGTRPGDVVLAYVRLSRAKIASFEPAKRRDDEKPSYFAVDSGNACFVDASAAATFVAEEHVRDARISARLAAAGVDPTGDSWNEAYDRARDEEGDPISALTMTLGRDDWGEVVLDEDSGANVVAFKSGAGDGTYACYWGLDAKGKPAALVIDFGLLRTQSEEELAESEGAEVEQEREDDDLDDFDIDDDFFRDRLDDEDDLAFRAERPPASSPLLPRAVALLASWEKSGKLEIAAGSDRDALAEALLEKLVSLEGHRHLGSHLSEWLMERSEIADVFASDDELEADLRKR